jgi:hypothetical protein
MGIGAAEQKTFYPTASDTSDGERPWIENLRRWRRLRCGANLLTPFLQTAAPTEFMEKPIAMIKEKSPGYMNLPDASGGTPLYIAVDRNDEDQIRMLFDAGASPMQIPGCGPEALRFGYE